MAIKHWFRYHNMTSNLFPEDCVIKNGIGRECLGGSVG